MLNDILTIIVVLVMLIAATLGDIVRYKPANTVVGLCLTFVVNTIGFAGCLLLAGLCVAYTHYIWGFHIVLATIMTFMCLLIFMHLLQRIIIGVLKRFAGGIE